jgi:hypothetical protein
LVTENSYLLGKWVKIRRACNNDTAKPFTSSSKAVFGIKKEESIFWNSIGILL